MSSDVYNDLIKENYELKAQLFGNSPMLDKNIQVALELKRISDDLTSMIEFIRNHEFSKYSTAADYATLLPLMEEFYSHKRHQILEGLINPIKSQL